MIPARRSFSTLLLLLWQITYGGARTLVWGSLRESAIDLRPLSWAARLVALVGLGLIILLLAGILFNDILRTNGPLVALQLDSASGRAALAPAIALPLTLGVQALGWSLALAGALQVRPAARLLVIVCYILFGMQPLVGSLVLPTATPMLLAALPIGGLLLVSLLVLSRHPLPFALSFSLLGMLHSLLVALALAAAAQAQAASNSLFVGDLVSLVVQSCLLLSGPFLIIAGIGWVDFGLEVGGWIGQALHNVAQAWIVPLLLVLVLLVRLAQIARESAASDGVPWAAWGGAAVLCLGLAAIGVWRQRNPGGIAIERPVLIGVLGCTVIGPLVFSIISVVVADYFLLNPLAVGAMDQLNMILAQITALSDLEREYRQPGLALIALGLALAAQRRGNPANTQVGLVFAWCLGWRWLTSEGRPLAALQFGHAEVDAVLLVGFALLAGYWALQRTLTHERALRLLALGVLMALLNQTDFLDNPFSPIFSFAGVFFLVFGIVWNVLTSGGAYLNADSPGFPRSGRLMLYLGYMLISVNVAHWYLVTHAVDVQATQAAIQNSGYLIYGLPIAYLALTSGGAEFVEEAIERPGTG